MFSRKVRKLGLTSRFSPLVLLPCHQSTGSCSSTRKPASDSRPLHAGRRLPSHQAPDRLVPEGLHAFGFDDIKLLNDASSMGLLSFVFRMHTCSRSCLELLLQRSPPRLFTAAAWSGSSELLDNLVGAYQGCWRNIYVNSLGGLEV